ncbi:MAG: hypothetical protein L6Q59_15545 [Ignavibacteriaceae bacterium]|nr:hypothetical protein [Ignavibacteriaceae bacterium]
MIKKSPLFINLIYSGDLFKLMTLMTLLLTVDTVSLRRAVVTDFVEVAGVSQRDAFGSQGDAFGSQGDAFGKNPRPKLSFNISG